MSNSGKISNDFVANGPLEIVKIAIERNLNSELDMSLNFIDSTGKNLIIDLKNVTDLRMGIKSLQVSSLSIVDLRHRGLEVAKWEIVDYEDGDLHGFATDFKII